jgi:hypothetical protein
VTDTAVSVVLRLMLAWRMGFLTSFPLESPLFSSTGLHLPANGMVNGPGLCKCRPGPLHGK